MSTSEDEASKRSVARQLMAGQGWGLSVEVLQELYVNVTGPARQAMAHAGATPVKALWRA